MFAKILVSRKEQVSHEQQVTISYLAAAHVKKAKAAKKEDNDLTIASLVEDDSYASEPDPVSTGLPPLPQLAAADAVKLRKAKTHWREDVVRNDGVNRGLLDLPLDRVKAMTPGQRK